MIIIIRALSPKKKKAKEKKDKEKKKKKRKGQRKKEKRKKNKKIKGAMLLSLFPHLCFKVAPCSLYSESHILCFKVAPCFHVESLIGCHFHILVGIFHYRTWLVYSYDGLPQNSLGLCEQASWMHTHLVSFVELSYIYSSSASVAWQSLLLALTSIYGHLHSPLISRVNVRLSPFLSSPHNLHHHILFHP